MDDTWTVWEGGPVWNRATRSYDRPPDRIVAERVTRNQADALIRRSGHNRFATPTRTTTERI